MTQVPSFSSGEIGLQHSPGRTLDGSGYSRSPASRSNMRVRTANGAGTPGVGQEGLTHAESARSGRPLVTVQPRQRDTRRVPPSAADRNMSASSPSRGVSGAPERRGAPSWARRRGSNSTTTADTPSPAADDPTPRPPRTARTAVGPVDEPTTASARTQPTRPRPAGGRRARPLTAAVLSRRNAKPDQVDVTHPGCDPDDSPAHDRTEPDPNGDPEPAALPRPHASPAPAGRTQTEDPFKPARRGGSNSTTTADTPTPAADDPTPRPPRTARTARSVRSPSETTAAATGEVGPVDEPTTASARTQPTRPRPAGGRRARPLTAAVLSRRNAKPDQVDVTHPGCDPDDSPAHDRTEPDPNGDPEPAALPRPHASPAPAGRTQTEDPFKPARRRGSNSTTTADTPTPAADDPTPRPPRTARTARSVRSPSETTAAATGEVGPVDEPTTASARTQPTRPRPAGGRRARPLTAAVLSRRNAKPDQVDVTHPGCDPDDSPAHDRTEPDPNGDPEPAALPRPHASPAPAGRTQRLRPSLARRDRHLPCRATLSCGRLDLEHSWRSKDVPSLLSSPRG